MVSLLSFFGEEWETGSLEQASFLNAYYSRIGLTLALYGGP